LSLLFAKRTVGLGGIMAGLPLPQRIAKTIGGEVVFLGGRKWSVRILVKLYDLSCRHLTLGLKLGR